MKNYFKLSILILAVALYSCGGGESEASKGNEQAQMNPNNPNNPNYNKSGDEQASTSDAEETSEESNEDVPPSKQINLEDKGVGPIDNVELAEEIDQDLVDEGKTLYEAKCTICHHVDKKVIGPPQAGIMERRTPEWTMNMIMNPSGMVQEDDLAKALLEEFNGVPMTDQGITEDEARAILEYFRTL